MTQRWNYKVVKSMRGMQGQWFRFPTAATFATEAEARAYAQAFAAEQKGTGARINVIPRRRIHALNSIAEYRT